MSELRCFIYKMRGFRNTAYTSDFFISKRKIDSIINKTNFDNHEESDLQPEGTGRHRPL